MLKGEPIFMQCSVKWRLLNVDYSAWITTVVEVIQQECSFYYKLFSTDIKNFDKRAKFLLAKSIEEFFFLLLFNTKLIP